MDRLRLTPELLGVAKAMHVILYRYGTQEKLLILRHLEELIRRELLPPSN
jgi:hypothetical protein